MLICSRVAKNGIALFIQKKRNFTPYHLPQKNKLQGPVIHVSMVNNAIQWINGYPADK